MDCRLAVVTLPLQCCDDDGMRAGMRRPLSYLHDGDCLSHVSAVRLVTTCDAFNCISIQMHQHATASAHATANAELVRRKSY